MKKIVLLFVSLICVNVYAANIRINDSPKLIECAANTVFVSENSFGLQYSNTHFINYAVKKQGMFFLRTELGFVPSLSIGYGGTTQVFLNAGIGMMGILTGFDNDRRVSFG
ncbi:MAG: hypothetical protein J5725_08235, partial [Bacteroidales bacterium]|nr:hypothetical protein [Bacteroidales bacterium]